VIHLSVMASHAAIEALRRALAVEHVDVDLVAAVWERARAAHPAIAIDDVALMSFAGARTRSVAELAERHVEDLYLACACAAGDRAALVTLERDVLPGVARGLGGIASSDDMRREVVQMLREQMLVGETPGIAGYDGRAPLLVWLRVCAVRMGLRVAQREQRAEELDDDRLDQLAPGVPDPALALMQQLYGAQFRTAFRGATASLEPRERNLLRHAVLHALGIDQIAAIYHVHRATAARQIKQAREKLVAATRERMRVALGVGETELDSIFRVLVSMADITLREILEPPPPWKSER
jgi:RNA polymerase sigma-70 factor (ECF subfamily)